MCGPDADRVAAGHGPGGRGRLQIANLNPRASFILRMDTLLLAGILPPEEAGSIVLSNAAGLWNYSGIKPNAFRGPT
jgi:hypothetical protein